MCHQSFISLFLLLFTLDPIDVIDEFIELRGDELDVEGGSVSEDMLLKNPVFLNPFLEY